MTAKSVTKVSIAPLVLLLLAAACPGGLAQAAPLPAPPVKEAQADDLQLSISCQKASYSTEEPVILDVRLLNKRPMALVFDEGGRPLSDITFEVRYVPIRGQYDAYEIKQDVPSRAYGDFLLNGLKLKKNHYIVSNHGWGVSVPPNTSATCRYSLSRMFDMSLQGVYTITMKKGLPNRMGTGNVTVVSNTLRVSIMEPHDPGYNVWVSPPPLHPDETPRVGQYQLKF